MQELIERLDKIEEALRAPSREYLDAAPKPSEPKAAEKSGAPPKATIGDSVRRLLLDGSLSYAQIVEMVKAAHPEAATTARSVASVACAMRKDGTDVPTRRAAKGAE